MRINSDQQPARGWRQEWLFGLTLLIPSAVGALATTYPWASSLTLLHDPFKISEAISPLHPLMGSLSSIGAVLLFCSSAIAIFSATLVRRPSSRRFLIYAGLYSSLLASDDLFGLHDKVLQDFEIREGYVKLVYVAGQVIYIVAFYKLLKRTDYRLLVGALSLFAISLFFDSRLAVIVQNYLLDSPLTSAGREAWEDLPKLAGAVFWLWFHMLAARDIILGEERVQAHSSTPSG